MKYLSITLLMMLFTQVSFAQKAGDTVVAKGKIEGKIWWDLEKIEKKIAYYYKSKVTDVVTTLQYVYWGEGKIRGQLVFKGVSNCKRDKFISFVGVDRGVGEITLFNNAQDLVADKNPIGSIVDFGKNVHVDLSLLDVENITLDEENNSCSLSITKSTAIVLDKK